MSDIYTRVNRLEYLNLIKRCEALEKENTTLKAELKKATAKKTEEKVEIKTETKKGGSK